MKTVPNFLTRNDLKILKKITNKCFKLFKKIITQKWNVWKKERNLHGCKSLTEASNEKIQITEKPEYSGPVTNETNKPLSSCFNKWIHQSVGYSTNFAEQRRIRKY